MDSGGTFFGVTPLAVWDQVTVSLRSSKNSGRLTGKNTSALNFFGFRSALRP